MIQELIQRPFFPDRDATSLMLGSNANIYIDAISSILYLEKTKIST
ncbi:MAG TPA: hypothetical protein PK465_05800 [Saccharofermentans sp.]|nr:hypothetical protein [Saccharofermentans sp.]HPQ32526.1 hypothetical protein [Saccharofermentans sp.]